MIGLVWKITIAQGGTELRSNEAIFVIVMAFVLATIAALYLRTAGSHIITKGELKGLQWFYTGTGQAAAFIAVFLIIVAAYIALRLAPGT